MYPVLCSVSLNSVFLVPLSSDMDAVRLSNHGWRWLSTRSASTFWTITHAPTSSCSSVRTPPIATIEGNSRKQCADWKHNSIAEKNYTHTHRPKEYSGRSTSRIAERDPSRRRATKFSPAPQNLAKLNNLPYQTSLTMPMCNLALQSSKRITTMIRKECIHFNTFPASMALEKMEACKLFGAKNLTGNLTLPLLDRTFSIDELGETFPTIKWEDDVVDLVFEESQQRISLIISERGHEASRSHKRRKIASGYSTDSGPQEESKGLLRSKRIRTELHLLDDQLENYGLCDETKPMISYYTPSLDTISSFSSGHDVAFEKHLQMSFCENNGDNQVTIIAWCVVVINTGDTISPTIEGGAGIYVKSSSVPVYIPLLFSDHSLSFTSEIDKCCTYLRFRSTRNIRETSFLILGSHLLIMIPIKHSHPSQWIKQRLHTNSWKEVQTTKQWCSEIHKFED